MSLFHKVYSKYYEAVTRLINAGKDYSKVQIDEYFRDEISGETDSKVQKALFSQKLPSLFCYEKGKFHSYINRHVPVLCTRLEREAAKSICSLPSASLFLSEELLEKLARATEDVESQWNMGDIIVNQRRDSSHREDDVSQEAKQEEDVPATAEGGAERSGEYREKLAVLTAALRSRKAVACEEAAQLYPVKLEYSYRYDEFYLWAFEPGRNCYVKRSLQELTKLHATQQTFEGYNADITDFMKENQKEAELEIKTNELLAEECFRVFSYYAREASYEAGEAVYRLKIFYQPDEEGDLIGDILSLGSAVTVLAPGEMREKLCSRIRKALENYEHL